MVSAILFLLLALVSLWLSEHFRAQPRQAVNV